MLSALGQLNSQLLSSHYSSTMPHPSETTNMVRRAKALKDHATKNLQIAQQQQHLLEEDVAMIKDAAFMRHVARHTQKNTICVGPCVRIPIAKVQEIQNAAIKIHGKHRVDAVRELTNIFKGLQHTNQWPHDNPRMCASTGVPCVAAQIGQSDNVRRVVDMYDEYIAKGQHRVKLAEEILKEAMYTADLASSTGMSQVSEMGVGQFYPHELNGGDTSPESTRENIANFFYMYLPGERVPDTDNMRDALEIVSKRFAPRAREDILEDLWLRWNHTKTQ
jgi:hypothetical protein